MIIRGTRQEFVSLFNIYDSFRSDNIQFLFPNRIFMLSEDGNDYVYINSVFEIGRPVMLPGLSIGNLRKYINRTRLSAQANYNNERSPFFMRRIEQIEVGSDAITFNNNDESKINVSLNFAYLSRSIEEKYEKVMNAPAEKDVPYIKFSSSVYDEIHKVLGDNNHNYDIKSPKSIGNNIRIENGAIHLSTNDEDIAVDVDTGITSFQSNIKDGSVEIPFHGKSLYIFDWIKNLTAFDVVTMKLVGNYCIVGGYYQGMLVARIRIAL